MRARLDPEAAYVANLPSLYAYRLAIERLRAWHQCGVITMVYQTSNRVLADHFTRRGAMATYVTHHRDARGQYVWQSARYIMLPEAFDRWLALTSTPRRPLP